MSEKSEFENTIPEDLLPMKISAYQGVKAGNNRLVLGYLASHGPSLPYVVFKNLVGLNYDEKQYPTVYRRIKALVKEGYLTEAGTRLTLRGKQSEETLYGLTTLGWVASLVIDKIRKNMLRTLKLNLDTIVPEKRVVLDIELNTRAMFPGLIEVIEYAYSEDELNAITTSLILGYLHTSAPSIDELARAPIEQWIPWIKPIIESATLESERLLPQGINRTINLFQLLDDPKIFEFVNQLLPIISSYAERQIHTYIMWLFASAGLRDAFENMNSEVMPSQVAESFISQKLPRILQEYEASLHKKEGESA